jgi:hypothetical protein
MGWLLLALLLFSFVDSLFAAWGKPSLVNRTTGACVPVPWKRWAIALTYLCITAVYLAWWLAPGGRFIR